MSEREQLPIDEVRPGKVGEFRRYGTTPPLARACRPGARGEVRRFRHTSHQPRQGSAASGSSSRTGARPSTIGRSAPGRRNDQGVESPGMRPPAALRTGDRATDRRKGHESCISRRTSHRSRHTQRMGAPRRAPSYGMEAAPRAPPSFPDVPRFTSTGASGSRGRAREDLRVQERVAPRPGPAPRPGTAVREQSKQVASRNRHRGTSMAGQGTLRPASPSEIRPRHRGAGAHAQRSSRLCGSGLSFRLLARPRAGIVPPGPTRSPAPACQRRSTQQAICRASANARPSPGPNCLGPRARVAPTRSQLIAPARLHRPHPEPVACPRDRKPPRKGTGSDLRGEARAQRGELPAVGVGFPEPGENLLALANVSPTICHGASRRGVLLARRG